MCATVPVYSVEMVRSKIFQARTAHSPQHPAHNRQWTEDIYTFSNRPAHGPLHNWQTCIFFPPEAKYLSWLFCLPRQNICWDYFAFCGTWLVEVVMSCDKHNMQSCMHRLVPKPKTPNSKPKTPDAMLQWKRSFTPVTKQQQSSPNEITLLLGLFGSLRHIYSGRICVFFVGFVISDMWCASLCDDPLHPKLNLKSLTKK